MGHFSVNTSVVDTANLLAGGQSSLSDLDAACAASGLGRAEMCDAVAMYVARGFLDGTLEYDFGDATMNDLVVLTQYEVPPLAWYVFNAFDQGEWHHSNDPPEIDPVEKYTRPMLLEALAQSCNSRSPT